MSVTGGFSQALVIDANLAIWTVLPVLQGKGVDVDVTDTIARWERREVSLIAPAWWLAECTSALRMAVHYGIISNEVARQAIDDIFALDVALVPIDSDLCKSALDWAERLKQVRAYDAIYVALAHLFGADLWTADKRLANAGKQMHLNWIHWIGDSNA